MPERVIRNARVEDSAWRFLAADHDAVAPFPVGPLAVPLAVWKARRGELLGRTDPTGVWLQPADEPAEIAADLAGLALVAVHFPKFNEGRGYSTAALLRRRYGYRGELRAYGDIGRDHLYYLARVGFDAFELRAGTNLDAAVAGLRDFSVRYQAATDEAKPLFRHRFPEARA